jgi:hypothetical protein
VAGRGSMDRPPRRLTRRNRQSQSLDAISSDTRVIISVYLFRKLSDDHPCILRYTAEG